MTLEVGTMAKVTAVRLEADGGDVELTLSVTRSAWPVGATVGPKASEFLPQDIRDALRTWLDR